MSETALAAALERAWMHELDGHAECEPGACEVQRVRLADATRPIVECGQCRAPLTVAGYCDNCQRHMFRLYDGEAEG